MSIDGGGGGAMSSRHAQRAFLLADEAGAALSAALL